MSARAYLRCRHCLTRAVIDLPAAPPAGPRAAEAVRELLTLTRCGVCRGGFRFDGLVHSTSPRDLDCDRRCTHAPGPTCTCSCGGRNHGSALLVDVVNHDRPATTVAACSPDRAAALRVRVASYLARISTLQAAPIMAAYYLNLRMTPAAAAYARAVAAHLVDASAATSWTARDAAVDRAAFELERSRQALAQDTTAARACH